MSKQQWKTIALALITLLISVLILISITPLSGEVLAQRTSVQQCLSSTDWIFQAAESLNDRYGVDVCRQGKFQVNESETRADMAGWLATAMDSVNEKLLKPGIKNRLKKSELDSLNQLLDQITAQVEALERR